jgi:hypothetical protein
LKFWVLDAKDVITREGGLSSNRRRLRLLDHPVKPDDDVCNVEPLAA